MTQIKDSLFIITGAASGIGQATAVLAAAERADVLACDVDTKGLAKTVADQPLGGGTITPIELDVSDKSAILTFAEHVNQEHPDRRIILFNNAGVALGSGTFAQTDLDDFEWLLNINLWGVIRMTKAFLPRLLADNQGHIINVSSVFGLMGPPQQSAYSTAKFGVRGFTDVLRNELKATPIRIATVFPGGVKTNIAASARITLPYTNAEKLETLRRFRESARTTPEQAAQTILSGIRHNKTRILVGPDAHAFDLLTRLMPVRYANLVLPLLERAMNLGK